MQLGLLTAKTGCHCPWEEAVISGPACRGMETPAANPGVLAQRSPDQFFSISHLTHLMREAVAAQWSSINDPFPCPSTSHLHPSLSPFSTTTTRHHIFVPHFSATDVSVTRNRFASLEARNVCCRRGRHTRLCLHWKLDWELGTALH